MHFDARRVAWASMWSLGKRLSCPSAPSTRQLVLTFADTGWGPELPAGLIPAVVLMGSNNPVGTLLGGLTRWWALRLCLHLFNSARSFFDASRMFQMGLPRRFTRPSARYGTPRHSAILGGLSSRVLPANRRLSTTYCRIRSSRTRAGPISKPVIRRAKNGKQSGLLRYGEPESV